MGPTEISIGSIGPADIKTSELSYLDGNPGRSLEMGKNHSLLDGLEDGFFHKWMRTRGTRPGKPLHKLWTITIFHG